jgi:hypothetical protein
MPRLHRLFKAKLIEMADPKKILAGEQERLGLCGDNEKTHIHE